MSTKKKAKKLARTCVTFTADQVAKIDAAAEYLGMTRAAYIRGATLSRIKSEK